MRPDMPFDKPRAHGRHFRERSLEESSVTVWLTPENAAFSRENGLLYLQMGETRSRVSLCRDFPFDLVWEYISVLNEDEEELGIIRNVDDFEGETRDLLRNELERRYYSPKIQSILGVKERYGFSYWRVMTDDGEIRFTLHDTYKNLIHVSAKRVIFLDVDGNRFEIPDIGQLDRRSYRKIEIYL